MPTGNVSVTGMTTRFGVYCLMAGMMLVLIPAVGRSQWAVDPEYRFGFASAVAGPTLSTGTMMNPATLNGTSFSISISDEFGLSDLRSGFATVVHSRGNISIGLQLGSFGYALYREWHGAGSFAYRLGQSGVGISFLADHLAIPGYGHGMALSSRFGTRYSVSETVSVGISADRVLLKRTGDIQVDVPVSWMAALNWNWIPPADLSLGVQSFIGYAPTGSLALRWSPVDFLTLSIGHEPITGRWTTGIRVHVQQWSVPLGGTFHSELGWSRYVGARWDNGVKQ